MMLKLGCDTTDDEATQSQHGFYTPDVLSSVLAVEGVAIQAEMRTKHNSSVDSNLAVGQTAHELSRLPYW